MFLRQAMTGVKPPPPRRVGGGTVHLKNCTNTSLEFRLVVFQGAGFENDENLKRVRASGVAGRIDTCISPLAAP